MTPNGRLPLVVEPDLAEAAVLAALGGQRAEREFRRRRDALYAIGDADARERAFRDLHGAWFDRLGLGDPLCDAVGSLPVLAGQCRRCLLATARTAGDEGADLLVASREDGGERTLLVRLRVATLLDRRAAGALLRRELLHVADMLDPSFGYAPELPVDGAEPMRARLLRDRYRVLWNVRVAGRLWREGHARERLRDEAYRSFAATFPMLGSGAEESFRRFFEGIAGTHAELVAFAAAPRAAAAQEAALAPGAPCPLCRFPTHHPEPCPEQIAVEVLERIAADFPGWTAARGLCRQCADLYRARPLSLAAAARLPG